MKDQPMPIYKLVIYRDGYVWVVQELSNGYYKLIYCLGDGHVTYTNGR